MKGLSRMDNNYNWEVGVWSPLASIHNCRIMRWVILYHKMKGPTILGISRPEPHGFGWKKGQGVKWSRKAFMYGMCPERLLGILRQGQAQFACLLCANSQMNLPQKLPPEPNVSLNTARMEELEGSISSVLPLSTDPPLCTSKEEPKALYENIRPQWICSYFCSIS